MLTPEQVLKNIEAVVKEAAEELAATGHTLPEAAAIKGFRATACCGAKHQSQSKRRGLERRYPWLAAAETLAEALEHLEEARGAYAAGTLGGVPDDDLPF
jgi:predicted RNase H-like HicB family nuclease